MNIEKPWHTPRLNYDREFPIQLHVTTFARFVLKKCVETVRVNKLSGKKQVVIRTD